MKVCRPETEAKYRTALELYRNTDLPTTEICRRCGVSNSGFARYINTYYRHLMLRRNGILCSPEEAGNIKISTRQRQLPATHAKYKKAIEACDSMEYIGCNISEIAREFDLDGTNLANQLRRHYPDVLKRREQARQKLGLADGLPRGVRPWCEEQYAEAVELLRSDRYITVKEAADRCNVSYTGLENHLIFYHKDLIECRISKRKQSVGRKEKGQITGRGTIHEPSDDITEKYVSALTLYRTTPLSVRQIAKRTGVSAKGLYEYLNTWHKDLVAGRGGKNPAAAAKYADAIALLKAGETNIAKAAAEFSLNPDTFRHYLKKHEPELATLFGMRRSNDGKLVAVKSEEKYAEAVRRYQETSEPLKSIARSLSLNESSLRQFIKRRYPEISGKSREKLKKSDSDDKTCLSEKNFAT